jgi:hypothetical protein
MALIINIDTAALTKELKEFAEQAERDIKDSMANLSTIAHAKIVELASQKLKTTREIFLDSLSAPEKLTDGVYVISLDKKAFFIEEGIEPNTDMKEWLLKGGKISKGGYKYKVIPFEHSKVPSQLTPKAKNIVSQIKTNLKKAKVPFRGIEKNPDGSPRLGKLHSLNFPSDIPGKGNTPALSGVSIYQTLTQTGNVRRDIMTFRTATNSPAGQGKFIHPGSEGKEIMDEAATWAEKIFYDEILPEILEKWK